ncbi:SDR family oxidoreductase [Deinococcus wulumuqiensis]|uniref:SDR family oxidoreductase n=1 Tax=Deinococcus wulumuqiensis TaxID=980427 RepID=UPI00243015AF|nr:SDR family NAD(P)-dependent oxidoreductase [Deinococcus wulumuqiensis]
MNLNGKTALVTGGTDGIGAELVRQLRDKGATVIVVGRNPERIAATRAAGFEVIAADLSTPQGVRRVVEAVGDRPIHLLVNNAGMGVKHDFRSEPPDLDQADRAIFLNLNAPIHLITELMPRLRALPHATIVNVTSGNAIAPRAAEPVYSATKAALRSYTLALRAQLEGTGVHVLEALPPAVDTRMAQGMRGRIRMLSPAECARQIVEATEHQRNEANIGMVRLLQLGYSVSPALARQFMLRL